MKISFVSVMKGALRGKTLARIYFNETLKHHSAKLTGRALDLAGGAHASYLPLLPASLEVVHTDRTAAADVVAADINARLPFQDGSFDAVFLFNAMYIVDDPPALAREVRRVLKPEGRWLILSPFIANEMPEPHDYLRFTAEGLERLSKNAGFTGVEIERLGERASAAAHLMHDFFFFRIIRAAAFATAVLLDRLIPERARRNHPTPISYWCVLRK